MHFIVKSETSEATLTEEHSFIIDTQGNVHHSLYINPNGNDEETVTEAYDDAWLVETVKDALELIESEKEKHQKALDNLNSCYQALKDKKTLISHVEERDEE